MKYLNKARKLWVEAWWMAYHEASARLKVLGDGPTYLSFTVAMKLYWVKQIMRKKKYVKSHSLMSRTDERYHFEEIAPCSEV